MATGGGNSNRKVCRYFLTGGCWFGNACHFLHAENEQPEKCRFYRTVTGCRYGETCFYLHDASSSESLLAPSELAIMIESWRSLPFTSDSPRQSPAITSNDPWVSDPAEKTDSLTECLRAQTLFASESGKSSSDGKGTHGVTPEKVDGALRDIISPIQMVSPDKAELAASFGGLEMTSSTPMKEGPASIGSEGIGKEPRKDEAKHQDVKKNVEEACCPCGNRGKCCSCICAKSGCTNCKNRNCRFKIQKENSEDDQVVTKLKPLKKKHSLVAVQTATCGHCSEKIKEQNLSKALTQHYIERLLAADQNHMRFFSQHYQFSEASFWCGACTKIYSGIKGFMSHMKSKLANVNKPKERQTHAKMMDMIVQPFIEHDLGTLCRSDVLGRLMLMLLSCYIYDDDTTPQLMRRMKKVNTMTGVELQREMQKREVNFDDLFMPTDPDDINDLLCQGIKPWDSEAGAALDALYDF